MPNRSDLAKIHIAKQELGLDEATYRDILQKRYRQDSAAGLTPGQAADLIALFRDKGWRPASAAQRGLIHVLWRKLQAAGAIRHGGEDALNAYIAHFTGHDNLNRLNVRDASKLIEMLKKWSEREGIDDRLH